MTDRLSTMMEIQKEFTRKVIRKMFNKEIEDLSREEIGAYIKEVFVHIIVETYEVLNETPWKMHRRDNYKEIDREKILEEIVDIDKFHKNFLVVLGITEEEYYDPIWDFVHENNKTIDDCFKKGCDYCQQAKEKIIQFGKGYLEDIRTYESALKDFTTLVQTITDNDMVYFNYGLSLYFLENPEKAAEAFEKAISLNDQEESYFTYRALAKADQDDISGALDDIQRAIDLNADNPDSYFNSAKVLYQFEEYDAALDDLILTFSLDPEYEGLHLMLAEVYSVLGEVDLAMKYYDLSIMFDPENAENLFKRGVFLYEIENVDGAMDDFNQAIKLDESVPAPYTNRGLLRFELKDKSGACEDWKKAFQLGSAYAQELLKKNCR